MSQRKQNSHRNSPSRPAVEIERPHSRANDVWHAAIAFAVIAAAVWGVYGLVLDAPFIFDDLLSVEENPSVVRLWPLWGDSEHPGPLNPPVELPTSARPLVNLSFAVNYHFGLLDPRGYRAVNIALHMLSAMLLWAIVRRTLRLPRFGGRFDRAAPGLALAVALLWALHPLVTEAVVYVTQRTELMMAFFYLATLYCSFRYWDAATLNVRTVWLVSATMVCLAGAASKEVMVSAPLVVFLFERTFVSGSFRETWRRSWPLYLGLMLSWVLIVALQANSPRAESAGFGLDVPVVAWWLTQAKIFVIYLKLAIWPWPLVLHYELSKLEPLRAVWPQVLAVAAIAVATLVLVWRRNLVGFLAACVFAILAPTHLMPIPTEVAAERRMYLPLAALVALVVIGGFWLLERVARRMAHGRELIVAATTLVLVLAVVYGTVSAYRLEIFRDQVRLWQETVALQPNNHIAQDNLATALLASQRPHEAIAHYRAALRLKPDFTKARYHLGLALAADGQLDEAIEHLTEVVRQKPDAYKIRNNLGVTLFTAGRLPEAIEQFRKTLELKPDLADVQENLARALDEAQQAALPATPQ